MTYKASGIVLAGGKSSRMGTDKAMLQYHNQSLLSRSVEKLHELFEEVILVTNTTVKYHGPEFNTCRIREVYDEFPESGPLAGIHAGLKAASFEWSFVTACDMPFWGPEIVEALTRDQQDFDAVVPSINNRPEPLCAFYRKSCLPAIENHLKNGIGKVTCFYQFVKISYLDIKKIGQAEQLSSHTFSNINTPLDYETILSDQNKDTRLK